MITSSCGGRVFEVTTKGQVVWEWVSAYKPMGPNRYAYDFCPQLANLVPEEVPVDFSKLMPDIVGDASV